MWKLWFLPVTVFVYHHLNTILTVFNGDERRWKVMHDDGVWWTVKDDDDGGQCRMIMKGEWRLSTVKADERQLRTIRDDGVTMMYYDGRWR